MIDTQNERIRISEMAIRGVLSNRVETSVDIDDSILAVKLAREELIKNKETKLPKESDIIDAELFDIPSNWKWVPLGDLCIFLSRGKSPKYSEVKKIPVLAQKCNQAQRIELDKALFLDESSAEKWPGYFRLRNNDIVINSTGTGTIGRVGLFKSEVLSGQYEFMVPDSHITVARIGNNVVPKYIYYALRTRTIQGIMEKTYRGSTNQKEFYIDDVYSIPIPLPPFEEQQQIVSILDDAFEQFDIIDELQNKYEINTELLKEKIIEAGIKGRLTEQLNEDGSAEEILSHIQETKTQLIKKGKMRKEGALPDILEDDIPYEIPDSWKWVRVGNIALINPKNNIDDEMMVGFVPMASVSGGYNDNHSFEVRKWKDIKKGFSHFKNNDVGVAKITPCFQNRKSVIFRNLENGYGAGTTELTVIRPLVEEICPEYLLWYFKSKDFIMAGIDSFTGVVGQQRIHKDYIKNCLIPIPPFAEQKRIIDCINTAFKLL